MAKNTNKQGLTCEQMKTKIKELVETHNESTDLSERNKLAKEARDLNQDYNNTSVLDVYAQCLEAENPMLTFIKTYTYPTMSVGVKKDTGNLTIKDDGKAVMNLWDFVKWAARLNKQVVHAIDWEGKAEDTRQILLGIAEGNIVRDTKDDVGMMKAAMQAAFDSVIMLPGKSGNNAVIAKSKACRTIIMTCGSLDTKNLKATFGKSATWQGQFFMFLYCAVEGKEPELTFGDPDDQSIANAAAPAATTAPEATQETTAAAPTEPATK